MIYRASRQIAPVSVDFLSLIERGRKAPSFKTLGKIAKRLKMSVADLFTFDGT
jgi:DNA-binding XRE family transcriptional regulator